MISEYKCSDAMWQVVRLGILGGIMYGMYVVVTIPAREKQEEPSGGFVIAAIVLGGLIYWILLNAFEKLMLLIFKCEALGPFDTVFMQDDPLNVSNIMACCFLEPFDHEPMAEFFY